MRQEENQGHKTDLPRTKSKIYICGINTFLVEDTGGCKEPPRVKVGWVWISPGILEDGPVEQIVSYEKQTNGL
jgi:hypothetical protein